MQTPSRQPEPAPATLAQQRERARALHEAGHLAEAIRAQIGAINSAVRAGQLGAADCHRLGVMLFAAKDFNGAATAFGRARLIDPGFAALALNLGLSLLLAGRTRDAMAELAQAEKQTPEQPALLDALAHAWGRLGEIERARAYGERSLLAKDAQAGPVPLGACSRPGPAPPVPPFRTEQPTANIIAFSLFGDLPRYLDGALANARLAPQLYPGWTCRFYLDDSVPRATRTQLAEAGAQVRRMPAPRRKVDALFWRFLVADDPHVSRYLVRDADSVVNPREQAAVQAWLASDKPFHVMRDHAAHTDLVLAGLWGGVAGWLPALPELLKGFAYRPGSQSRSADQLFLGQCVWPRIRGHCLVHDSIFRCFGAKPFPAGAKLPPGRHVGDNAAAFN